MNVSLPYIGSHATTLPWLNVSEITLLTFVSDIGGMCANPTISFNFALFGNPIISSSWNLIMVKKLKLLWGIAFGLPGLDDPLEYVIVKTS